MSNLDQDFGYTAPLQDSGEGLIGDTIFLDADGDNVPDPGEGIEGVTVRLYDGTGTVEIAATYRRERQLLLRRPDPNGTYTVRVDTTTLPPGLVNTVDPDGGLDDESVSIALF